MGKRCLRLSNGHEVKFSRDPYNFFDDLVNTFIVVTFDKPHRSWRDFFRKLSEEIETTVALNFPNDVEALKWFVAFTLYYHTGEKVMKISREVQNPEKST